MSQVANTVRAQVAEQRRAILSARIKQRLIEMGMIASDLSRRSGVGRDLISNYMNKRGMPTLLKLERLAQALMTTPDFLLGNDEVNEFGGAPPRDKHSREDEHFEADYIPGTGEAWVRVSMRMPSAAVGQIMDIVKSVIEAKAPKSADKE